MTLMLFLGQIYAVYEITASQPVSPGQANCGQGCQLQKVASPDVLLKL
jgi:hypothetical protein